MSIVVLLVLMGALYAFMIVPQQRRLKAHQALIRSLEPGDVVVTSAGIHGAIAEIEDEVVWLEVAPNVELKISRGSIAERVADETDDEGSDETDDADASSSDGVAKGKSAEVSAETDVDDSDA